MFSRYSRVSRLRRILLAHVAEPSGKFRQPLAIGALAEPLNGKMIGLGELRAGQDGDARLEEYHVFEMAKGREG